MEIKINGIYKMMKAAISIFLVITSTSLFASIATDISSQQPIKVIFDNALNEDLNVSDIFQEIGVVNLNLTPAATAYATCHKLDAHLAILDYAFTAVASSEELIEDVANAARKCGISEEDLLSSALLNNIDPTTIAEATAAGPSDSSTTVISAPSFGNANGNGGGIASAN